MQKALQRHIGTPDTAVVIGECPIPCEFTRVITHDPSAGPLDAVDISGADLIAVRVDDAHVLAVLEGLKATLAAFMPVLWLESRLPAALALVESWGASVEADTAEAWLLRFGKSGPFPESKYRACGDFNWQVYKSGKHREMLDWVVNFVRQQGLTRIIDIGCGDGVFTKRMNAFGIDCNLRAINLAKARDVWCEHHNMYRLPELDMSFEAATLFDTLHHAPKPELLLRRIGEVVPILHVLHPDPKPMPHPWPKLTAAAVAELLLQTGWNIRDQHRFDLSTVNQKTFFSVTRG
jgi:hypothetical protein